MKKKRIFCALLCALLLCAPVRAAGGFADVPSGHWAEQSIVRAAELGIVQGTGGGQFGLGQQMTRAAFVTALCRTMSWQTVAPDNPTFSDVQDRSTWYYAAVETACANGALLTYSDRFRPDDPITREEMAVMLVRALGFASFAGTVQDDCPFADVTTSRGYICLAWHMGLMRGTSDTTFEPRRGSTREEAATLLLRAHDRLAAVCTLAHASAAPQGAVEAASITEAAGTLPMSPRAPLSAVYDAALQAGEGGTVALNTAPLLQRVENGEVTWQCTLTAEELAGYLALDSAAQLHSARYESSYLLLENSDGSRTVIWYESEEDIALKHFFCRLLGVSTVTCIG